MQVIEWLFIRASCKDIIQIYSQLPKHPISILQLLLSNNTLILNRYNRNCKSAVSIALCSKNCTNFSHATVLIVFFNLHTFLKPHLNNPNRPCYYLLCLTPNDFKCQGRASGWERVNYSIYIYILQFLLINKGDYWVAIIVLKLQCNW